MTTTPIFNFADAVTLDEGFFEELQSVRSERDDGLESVMRQWARLELYAAREDRKAVRQLLPQLPQSQLFPAQRQRLQELRTQYGPPDPRR